MFVTGVDFFKLRRVLKLVEISAQDETCFCNCTVWSFDNEAILFQKRLCGSVLQGICCVTCDVKLSLCTQ